MVSTASNAKPFLARTHLFEPCVTVCAGGYALPQPLSFCTVLRLVERYSGANPLAHTF